MHSVLETAVLAVFVLAGVWVYGSLIGRRLLARGKQAKPIVRRFRIGAITVTAGCFVVGSLYRGHVISYDLAIGLYIPLAIAFLVGLRLLQPYIRD